MGFQPFVIGNGLSAWRLLQRTLPSQMEAFKASAEQQRPVSHFVAAAPEVKSAEELVADRSALTVALGAYGLKDDLNNRFFIQRILEEGTTEPSALANRMADTRYSRLAGDLALDGLSRFTGILPSSAEKIAGRFVAQEFAISVGAQQPDLRLALNAQSELEYISGRTISDDAKWFLVMGNPPLRTVFEKALGLPQAFGQLDIETQLDVFREKASAAFGASEVDALGAPETTDALIDRFLLRQQLSAGAVQTSNSIALQLLQQ